MPPTNALRDQIAALRAAVAPDQTATKAVLPFGIGEIDDQLACGGLITQALHEIAPTTSTLSDDACAALFTAGIAARFASAPNANVLWALSRYDLYAPGLEQVGLGPGKLIHAEAREDADVLALVEDAARHGAFAAVVGEVRQASMTALRRLQLVAEDAGVPVLLLRRWKRAARCPLRLPCGRDRRDDELRPRRFPQRHAAHGHGQSATQPRAGDARQDLRHAQADHARPHRAGVAYGAEALDRADPRLDPDAAYAGEHRRNRGALYARRAGGTKSLRCRVPSPRGAPTGDGAGVVGGGSTGQELISAGLPRKVICGKPQPSLSTPS